MLHGKKPIKSKVKLGNIVSWIVFSLLKLGATLSL